MKIKMTTCLAGADFVHNPGDVVEMNDAQAKRLIEAGYAVPAKGNAKLETAEAKDDLEHAEAVETPKKAKK